MNLAGVDSRISQPIDVDQLSATVRALIMVERSRAPVVSCYLDCSDTAGLADDLKARELDVLSVAELESRAPLADAFERIRRYLSMELASTTRGVAVFVRAGDRPLFVAMQFRVALPVHVAVGEVPDIYHLIELKDTYDRYVVFMTSERSSRILEINLGAVTKELWTRHPQLRDGVAEQWGHDVYQRRYGDRDPREIDREVDMLDKLVTTNRHAYLILAGPADRTQLVRSRLSASLKQRLVETYSITGAAQVEDVVADTLAEFVRMEERESHDAAEELAEALRRGGLAVAGTQRSIHAIHHEQADLLVLAKEYASTAAWQCGRCDWIDASAARPATCSACSGTEQMRPVDSREGLVRLAASRHVEIELVANSAPLMRIGGVGCLLRYALGDKEWPAGYRE